MSAPTRHQVILPLLLLSLSGCGQKWAAWPAPTPGESWELREPVRITYADETVSRGRRTVTVESVRSDGDTLVAVQGDVQRRFEDPESGATQRLVIPLSRVIRIERRTDSEPGRRVRATLVPAATSRRPDRSDGPVVGVLASFEGDSLQILPAGETRAVALGVADIERLEISSGKRSNWLVGLAIGVPVGVAQRYAFGYTRPEDILTGVIAYGALGAGLGALFKTERWEGVSVEELRIEAGPLVTVVVRVPLRRGGSR